ncbi:hypothetical protein AA0Y32_06595 [Georgenia phoenicis]|uniref:hypothetical protein n=1 Tax=unclassified Georgenia TaxID=2626815 RepID=UPI0039AF0D87
MPVDIRSVLHRVVDEVFDDVSFGKMADDDEAPRGYGIRLRNSAGAHAPERHALITANNERFGAHLLDLDVGAIRFDYDDDEVGKEAELRDLAVLVRAYLYGAGDVTYRRSLVRRRPLPVLTIDAGGIQWRLGRHVSSWLEL